MKTRIFILIALSATLAACSSAPERNSSLEQARMRYTSAQANPQINALAPDELKAAGESLRTADKAMADKSAPATVNHLAYMSAQRTAIAEETASSRAAQAITSSAAAERDKMRLAMRTNEADTAQRQLAQSRHKVLRGDARANDLESQLRELNARQTPRGIVVTLGDLLFKTGQSRLLPGSATNMARLADFFRHNPDHTASIEGHTDSVGSASSNQALSERRANAVTMELIRLGVPADRLTTRAFGEESPVASNDSSTGRQMNRRVEIVFAQQTAGISAR